VIDARIPPALVVGDADEEVHPHHGWDSWSPAESVRCDGGAATSGWKVADAWEMAKGGSAAAGLPAIWLRTVSSMKLRDMHVAAAAERLRRGDEPGRDEQVAGAPGMVGYRGNRLGRGRLDTVRPRTMEEAQGNRDRAPSRWRRPTGKSYTGTRRTESVDVNSRSNVSWTRP